MKPSHPVNPIQSAPKRYAPSVPMSVYRELAAELRANKAVIDSLNSRNQQLLDQNQRLKQEIHNVVQATLNLGQFAGVARQTAQEEFPAAIAPDTLAKLVRAQGEARKVVTAEHYRNKQYSKHLTRNLFLSQPHTQSYKHPHKRESPGLFKPHLLR